MRVSRRCRVRSCRYRGRMATARGKRRPSWKYAVEQLVEPEAQPRQRVAREGAHDEDDRDGAEPDDEAVRQLPPEEAELSGEHGAVLVPVEGIGQGNRLGAQLPHALEAANDRDVQRHRDDEDHDRAESVPQQYRESRVSADTDFMSVALLHEDPLVEDAEQRGR